MGVRVLAAWLAPLVAASLLGANGCATQGDGGVATADSGDATDPVPESGSTGPDGTGPSPDAIILGVDADAPDVTLSGKSCVGLPDGTACGPAPDVCHEAPLCASGLCAPAMPKADGFVCAMASDVCHSDATCMAGVCPAPPPKPDGTDCAAAADVCHTDGVCTSGVCGAPAPKADGTVCANAPDACHTDGTCSGGKCGAVGDRPDGYNWSSGDATAICCSAAEVHADTNGNCGACGIKCNSSNGESCSALGGHYFCRGCIASSACWSHCCSESFSPYSCAASDCAGNCSSTYCPPGTHCVSGGATSSDYWLFVESGGGRSGGLTARHGRRDAEGEEAPNAIVGADGIGGHEAQLS